MKSLNANRSLFCRLLLVVALVLSPLLFLLAQAQAEILFGPEVFIRDSGKPVTVMREIITDGFESPFILYVQNGDDVGENRVSSAKVILNGTIVLGPPDFSQQVSGHEVQVELENPSTLEVRLASAPGSTLTIWIEGTPINPNVRVVGPEGGTLEFYNGIVLQVPPGALDREVEITIEDLPITEVDSILQSYGLIQKYFAGGFEGQPDGLNFKVPITVTIPVGPRESSGDLPLLFVVNRANGTYTLANTELRYDPTASTVSAKIQHFTDWVAVFGNDIHQKVDCNSSDWTVACKCKTITVREITEDIDVAGVCYVKGVVGLVTFEECPLRPEQSWDIREWERPDIDITPSPVEITSCTRSVTATVTDAEGKEIPNAWITWEADNPNIWLSSTTGKTVDVTVPSWSREGDIGRLFAETGCDTYQVASVTVSRPPDFILQIKKDSDFIYSGQEMELRAEAFGACEDPTGQISGAAIPVRWDIIDGSDVVEKKNEIDPNGLVVRGLKKGFATIRATAIDKEDVFADVTVEVRDPTVEVEAKIGNCDWNAKFCYFPSIQPTDITVRVGLIENGVKVWKDNVMVSILPSVKGQVATPSFGFTDANGEFHSTISGIQDAQPYIIAMASAYFGVGQSKSVTVRGITTISCTGGSYGADSSINYGTPEGVVSHTLTKDVAQKYSYCSVSTSAIGPPIVAGHSGWSIVGVSVDTEWWDTIQVIPYNLDHLGQNIELIVDVDASVSGDYETRADYPGLVTSAGAGASVITYGLLEDSYTAWGCYGDSCYPEEGESTRSTILLGAGSLWNVGSPMGIGEFGLCSSASEASSYSDPNTSAFYTSYATSEAEVSVQWLSISDIISYPSGTSIGGYYIFSCSGEEYNISEPPW